MDVDIHLLDQRCQCHLYFIIIIIIPSCFKFTLYDQFRLPTLSSVFSCLLPYTIQHWFAYYKTDNVKKTKSKKKRRGINKLKSIAWPPGKKMRKKHARNYKYYTRPSKYTHNNNSNNNDDTLTQASSLPSLFTFTLWFCFSLPLIITLSVSASIFYTHVYLANSSIA